MSATITLAKEEASGHIQHINDVDKKKGPIYQCFGCEGNDFLISIRTDPLRTQALFFMSLRQNKS